MVRLPNRAKVNGQAGEGLCLKKRRSLHDKGSTGWIAPPARRRLADQRLARFEYGEQSDPHAERKRHIAPGDQAELQQRLRTWQKQDQTCYAGNRRDDIAECCIVADQRIAHGRAERPVDQDQREDFGDQREED